MIIDDLIIPKYIVKLNEKIISSSDDLCIIKTFYEKKRDELIDKHKLYNSKKDFIELIDIDKDAILEQNEII